MSDEDYGFSPMERMRTERDTFRERAVAAERERDRLRREVEALREACRIPAKYGATRKYIVTRLDAILRGES